MVSKTLSIPYIDDDSPLCKLVKDLIDYIRILDIFIKIIEIDMTSVEPLCCISPGFFLKFMIDCSLDKNNRCDFTRDKTCLFEFTCYVVVVSWFDFMKSDYPHIVLFIFHVVPFSLFVVLVHDFITQSQIKSELDILIEKCVLIDASPGKSTRRCHYFVWNDFWFSVFF